MIVWGILLPESFLSSAPMALLASFVAINTILYVGLAVAKLFPKLYLSDFITSRNRRAETRSIHPDADI